MSYFKDRINSDVWGITCLFNPYQSRSRYLNYMYFQSQIRKQGLRLVTVELADCPQHLTLRQRDSDILITKIDNSELWQKESLLNLGLSRVPSSASVVCWLDADIVFFNDNWIDNLKNSILKYPVVHLFREMVYLPKMETKKIVSDFKIVGSGSSGSSGSSGKKIKYGQGVTGAVGSSLKKIMGSVAIFHETPKGKFINGKWGFGWAIRRDIIDRVGGFYNRCVVGGGDTVFFNGVFWDSLHEKFQDRYSVNQCEDIQRWVGELQQEIIRSKKKSFFHSTSNAGYLTGTIGHLWHGSFKSRSYFDRYQILLDGDFDPYMDITLSQGCLQWTSCDKPHKIRMIKGVSDYLKNRAYDKDSVEYDTSMESVVKLLQSV